MKEDNACVIDACVQLAQDYPDCLDTCTSSGGVPTATYKATCGTGNNWVCNATTHLCENPCDGASYNTYCQTCTPNGESVIIENVSGTCPDANQQNNWTCSNGTCIDPCSIGGPYPTSTCIPSWSAHEGYCLQDFAPSTTVCNTSLSGDGNHYCDGAGHCLCASGYYETNAGDCASCQVGDQPTTREKCEQCDGNWYDPSNGTCIPTLTCAANEWIALHFDPWQPPQRVFDYAACTSCTNATAADTAISEEACESCVDSAGLKLRFTSRDSFATPKCHFCGQTKLEIDMRPPILETDIQSCNNCRNRHFVLSADPEHTNSKCVCDENKVYSGTKCCPPGKKANANKNGCVNDDPEVCQTGYVYSYDDNACIPCENADGKATSDGGCESCNMIYSKYGYCHNQPEPGYIVDDAGETYACDSTVDSFGVLSQDMCDRCPNRFYQHKGSRKFCTRCDYRDPLDVYNAADCTKCSNRALEPDSLSCACNTSLVIVSRWVPVWNQETKQYEEPTGPRRMSICQELTP